MKRFGIIIILALTACTPRELGVELRLLDKELDRRHAYVEEFEKKNDLLRILLSESRSDSLKWVYAYKLFDAYRHFNLDSCARYNAMEKSLAVTEEQKLLSAFHDIYEMSFRGAQQEAASRFMAIDRSSLDESLHIECLALGIDIFKNDVSYMDDLKSLRCELQALDTTSYQGRKNLAMIYRDRGDYDRSLAIFQDCMDEFSDSHDMISIYYNIARIYGMTGQRTMSELWLARTAVQDVKCANKDYQSLYMLALQRLNDRDYARAVKYINAHYSDVSSSYFYPRIASSGVAEQFISHKYLNALKSIRWILTIGIILLTVLVIVVLYLLKKNRRKNQALQRAHDELRQANNELGLSNKIKEGYVFRYMMLAQRYMNEAQDNRNEYKRILRDSGSDELYKVLKQVDKGYSSDREFYRIFDDAFLGIFPNFISEVNCLLPESSRFDESSHVLPTEIRILAVIRLGITSSPDIAKFLKCSLPTVYTYRAKMRNLALCDKNDFEQIVSQIGL